MQTFTVEITDTAALQTLHELEANHLIKIIATKTPGGTPSPALPGEPMDLQAFTIWMEQAENTDTVDLNEAKLQWAKKRKHLLQATR